MHLDLPLRSISSLHNLTSMEPATKSEEVVIFILLSTIPTVMTADRTTTRAWDIYRTITENQGKSNFSHLCNRICAKACQLIQQ